MMIELSYKKDIYKQWNLLHTYVLIKHDVLHSFDSDEYYRICEAVLSASSRFLGFFICKFKNRYIMYVV